jgi:hypothetical protein
MRTHEFFYGLDPEGVETTINEYCNESVWSVHTIGKDNDGFWLLLTVVNV